MEIKKGNLNFDQTGRAYPDNPHIEENWDCIWEYEGKHYKLVGDINNKEWEEVMLETIQDAASKWVFETNGHKWSNNDDTAGDNYGSFIAGAEWQAERMYSEEDLRKAIALSRKSDYIKDWSGGIQALDKYDENEIIDIINKEKQ